MMIQKAQTSGIIITRLLVDDGRLLTEAVGVYSLPEMIKKWRRLK